MIGVIAQIHGSAGKGRLRTYLGRLPRLLARAFRGAGPTLMAAVAAWPCAAYAAPQRNQDLSTWDTKWGQIQHEPQDVALGDHWKVCGLKFRFRNYRDLFSCLDLIEQRVAKLDEKDPRRRYAPVLAGWMRTSAYAELGDDEEALKSAESAWAALPDYYREADTSKLEPGVWRFSEKKDDFSEVVVEAGGSKFDIKHLHGEPGMTEGEGSLNNPAGLDMLPPMIVTSLAAQRCVLHFQRGEAEQAQRALGDLNRWVQTRSASLLPGTAAVKRGIYAGFAFAQMYGPMYVMGDYAMVVNVYEGHEYGARMTKKMRFLSNVSSLGASYVYRRLFVRDARQFATELEESSIRYLYAESLAQVGETEKAEKTFDELLKNPEMRDMGNIYWATLYGRGRLALAKGRREEATRFLQQAVDAIERVRSTISFEAGKIGFATSKQAVYAALVGALADAGDWNGAFLVAERAKARALVDLLAKMHDLPPPPQASERVRQLMARAEQDEGQSGFGLGEQVEQTRNLSSVALSDLAQVSPEAGSLISVPSVALTDIAGRLAPDETLVNYFLTGDSLFALVMNGTSVTGLKLPAQGLADQIRAYRKSIESNNAAAEAQGRALYDRLIRPLASQIKGSRLTLCPHGALHYVPFAALLDGEQYLIDRYSVRVMPSASALAYLKTDKPEKVGKVLALGDPDLGDAKYDLPNALAEAVQVAQMFPDSRALLRKEASKTAFKQLGGSFSIIHFASHAVFSPDAPLASGLFLAKGDEPDGRLTVRELYAMRLDAQLVTLSACETGLGKVLSGDEVIGLTRGFFYAGARTIVASLWSVQDQATAELMISFYRNLAHTDQREALRLAQIQTRETHPAPALWAAFEITGSAN
jgi:CHAT domain-containing protein